jgi:hypothetical protein
MKSPVNRTMTLMAALRNSVARSLSTKGRVSHHSIYTLSAKSHVAATVRFSALGDIQRNTAQTFYLVGRIQQSSVYTLQTKANVNRRANITIKSHIKNSTYQFSTVQARIRNIVKRTTTIQAHVIRLHALATKARVRNTSIYPLQVKSRIVHTTYQTIGIKLRMISTLQTMCARANINFQFRVQARVSQQQGWPIPTPSAGNYFLFQPTQLKMSAIIIGPQHYAQSIIFKGRIDWTRNLIVSSKGRIILGNHIGIVAAIRPSSITVSLPSTFNVLGQTVFSTRMIYYVNGAFTTQAIGIGATIQQAQTTVQVTGHYLVRRINPVTITSVSPAIVAQINLVGVGAYIN